MSRTDDFFRSRVPLAIALLVVVVLVAYWPVLSCGWIWDDDDYVTENRHLQTLGGLFAVWVPGNTPQYYPLVFSSFWLEARIWGLDPAGFHTVNMLLHAVNVCLVWRLGRILCVPGAWFVAVLFAAHPVHVETVAWVTERKNVLSGAFYLLAALAYLRFDECRRQSRGGAGRLYAVALLSFVAALLSKTVTCSLPAALILMMAWQRRSLALRSLVPLLPMFGVGLLLALHTAYLEKTHVGADGADFDFSVIDRVWLANQGLVFYGWKLLVPWPLVFFYPRTDPAQIGLLGWWPALVVAAVGGVSVWALVRHGRRGPFVALAFFAGTLVPALGFFDVYPFRYSFVADHFQYLASLGFLTVVVSGVCVVVEDRGASMRRMALAMGCAGLVACIGLTWHQIGDYRDEETLWRQTLAKNPGAWAAYNNLAEVLVAKSPPELNEALQSVRQGLQYTEVQRSRDQMLLNVGIIQTKMGAHESALATFRQLQRTTPGQEVRIAEALDRLGRTDEAETMYLQALASPDIRRFALMRFGAHLRARGRDADAVPLFEEFVGLEPGDLDARMHLGDALWRVRRRDEAREIVRSVVADADASGQDAIGSVAERWLARRR